MKLKGNTRIEMTDVNTGKIDVVEESNMVTSALANQLAFFTPLFDHTTFNKKICSLGNNIMGGIKLFENTIPEFAENYYLPDIDTNRIIGYAGADTTDGSDPRRGSRNSLETKELDNGFQYVWDFATSEANGSISSLCITPTEGGRKAWFPYRETEVDVFHDAAIAQWLAEINFQKGYYYLISYSSYTIRVRKYRFDYSTLDLTNSIFTPICVQDESIQVTLPFSSTLYFRDGGDDYWYSVYTPGNYKDDATVHVCSLSKETLTFSHQTLSLPDVHAASNHNWNHTVYGGYLYLNKVPDGKTSSSYAKGFYKIDLSNTADISIIDFNEWSELSTTYWHISPAINGMIFANGILFSEQEHEVFFPDYGTSGKYYYGSSSSYMSRYCNYRYFSNFGVQLLAQYYSSDYFNCYASLDRNVLMTINNLSSPVVKTADKTMKIIYTITYDAEQ